MSKVIELLDEIRKRVENNVFINKAFVNDTLGLIDDYLSQQSAPIEMGQKWKCIAECTGVKVSGSKSEYFELGKIYDIKDIEDDEVLLSCVSLEDWSYVLDGIPGYKCATDICTAHNLSIIVEETEIRSKRMSNVDKVRESLTRIKYLEDCKVVSGDYDTIQYNVRFENDIKLLSSALDELETLRTVETIKITVPKREKGHCDNCGYETVPEWMVEKDDEV